MYMYTYKHCNFISGFLYEEFDSYILPFCFSGTMYFLSGALCLVVHCLTSGKANLISEGPANFDSTSTDEEPLSHQENMSVQ